MARRTECPLPLWDWVGGAATQDSALARPLTPALSLKGRGRFRSPINESVLGTPPHRGVVTRLSEA